MYNKRQLKQKKKGEKMTVQERIRISLLLEEMNQNREAAEKAGLKDVSIASFFNEKKDNNDDYSLNDCLLGE